MSMRKKERVAAVALLALFAFAFIYSRRFPTVPKMVPTLVTVLGGLLCVVLFVQTFFKQYKDENKAAPAPEANELPIVEDSEASAMPIEKTEEEKKAEEKKARITVIIALVLLAAYIILMKYIGFYVASFLYILSMSFLVEGKGAHKWWMYPVVALGILAVIYAIFSLFLKVPLPKGFLI